MPVVTSTEKDPSGVPLRNCLVRVQLVAAVNGAAPGYVTSGTPLNIMGDWSTRTDSDGAWSVTLVANPLILPANSYYIASVNPRVGRAIRHVFVVPNGAGPYAVSAILAATPTDLLTGGVDGGIPTSAFVMVLDGGSV